MIREKLDGALRLLRERSRRAWLRAKFELRWRYGQNPSSGRRFRANPPTLSCVQRRIIHDLCAMGVAFARFDDLGLDVEEWKRLTRVAQTHASSEKVAHGIEHFSHAATRARLPADAYIVKLYPEGPTLRLDNPLLRVGLASAVLDIVNVYLGLWGKLIYTDVWHSIPIDIGRRIGSQHWHRDPEDRRMIKIYVYFRDVGAGAGPLEYVPGSCSTGTGPYHTLWPWRPRGDRYPPDDELERRVPSSDRSLCVGSAGTFIFCDTNGFHRGGVATTGVRLAATWTFVTPAAMATLSPRRFVVEDFDPAASTDIASAARFALM